MESLIEVVISPSLSNLIVKREYRFVFTAEESYILIPYRDIKSQVNNQ